MPELKPLYPYAGGKGRLLKHFSNYLQRTDVYVEPFFGGGSVFCYAKNYNLARRYIVNDINPELIKIYRDIQDYAEDIIVEVKDIEREYVKLSSNDRKYKFWEESDLYRRNPSSGRLLFLLNTSFGCMWMRDRTTGIFDPSSGHNRRQCEGPSLISEFKLRLWHKALQDTEIVCGSYKKLAIPNDSLVFCDPPYLGAPDLYYSNFDNADQFEFFNWCNMLGQRASITVVHTNNTDGKFFEGLLAKAQNAIHSVYDAHHSNARGGKIGHEIVMVWNQMRGG